MWDGFQYDCVFKDLREPECLNAVAFKSASNVQCLYSSGWSVFLMLVDDT